MASRDEVETAMKDRSRRVGRGPDWKARAEAAEAERDVMDRNWRALEATHWQTVQRMAVVEAERDAALAALRGLLDAFDSWYTYQDRPSHPSEKIRRRELGAKRAAARALLAVDRG